MYEKGTKVYGFKYGTHAGVTQFSYTSTMDKFIGEIGTVVHCSNLATSLQFATGNQYAYPTEMIKNNLVDKEPEIDLKQLLTQIKSL